MERSNFIFSCVAMKDEKGYSALCLDVDVASEGGSLPEAKRNLREAVSLYVESAIENNLPIIRPVPPAERPHITRLEDTIEQFNLNVDVRVRAHV